MKIADENECKVVKSFELHILIQLFPLYPGQPSLTAPHQTEVRSPDALQHFLNNFTTNNAETAPTLNRESLFGSKTVKETKPRSCLELLKHLKPAKIIENKTKSQELMKYLAPIRHASGTMSRTIRNHNHDDNKYA